MVLLDHPREGKPKQTRKENKMEFWTMEKFEIIGDAMEELEEWEAFERDMETHPFD